MNKKGGSSIYSSKKQKGFTIAELLIVVSLLFIIFSFSMPVYSNLRSFSDLQENKKLLIQKMRILRSRSVAGQNGSQHGIKFQSNSYTLFQGSSYSARDLDYDEVVELESLNLSWSLENSNSEIVFSKGLGRPNTTGLVYLVDSSGNEEVIEINELGKIE